MSVVKKIGSLDDPAAFGGWIYRIARARSVDWVRKKIRDRDLKKDTAEMVETSKQISSARIGNSRQLEILGEALTRLPSEQHSILKMFYLEDRSVSEISLLLVIPEGTIKSRLFKARELLKKQLDRSI